MSIRRDLVIKVSNGSATLDMPLQIYEKDHGIELRFKLMDYKYKYDKDPENILNSNKEDILEAYTTIVNPSGYELAQINGEVVDDTVKFMIEDSYTDELEELGTYQLQIHVKCTHSEFSIPPVQFEVLERLKGEKVVTDGDDEVDNSVIIDGSTKFVDDETGKLIIQWQKGDTISSVRLNAMVEVINNAVDEEAQRQLNEIEREQQELEREQQELEREEQELEREQQELERENRLQAALNSVDTRVGESMDEYETRFNALITSQQQDAEVIDARDGEVSLKDRLDRDIEKAKQVYVNVEGSNISTDSSSGYAKDIEILGNTIQDASDLADIRSVGDKVEGRELYEIPVVSCGKNLFIDAIYKKEDTNRWSPKIKIDKTKSYVCKYDSSVRTPYIRFFDENLKLIPINETFSSKGRSISDASYFSIQYVNSLTNIQLEEGTQATPYEPYQEDKLTILSPVQLEKVGDVADRIICKDGVWGVEKNVETVVFNGSETWGEYSKTSAMINHSRARVFIKDCAEVSIVPSITDRFILANDDLDYEHYKLVYNSSNSTGYFWIYVQDSKLTSLNDEGFKEYAKVNPITVKYARYEPTFIPLPHDQQVKLRTFSNKTNISFLTEIEGTIKAQVPKSIGATINSHSEQIDNLNKELDRVKKLEESTVSTVVTDKDFTTVKETSNGYFEDVKLEGKTLVNRFIAGASSDNSVNITRQNTNKTINGVCTVLLGDMSKKIVVDICNINNDNWIRSVTNVEEGSTIINNIKIKLGDNEYIRTIYGKYSDGWTSSDIDNFKKILILEGDHTQNPPSYFEGLKSVGQSATTSEDGADEIVVSSVNENLFDINSDVRYKAQVYEKNKCILSYEEHTTKMEVVSDKLLVNFSQWRGLHFGVWLKPNTSYEISFDKSGDAYSNLINGRNTKIVTTNSKGKAYWVLEPSSNGYMILSNIMVKETSVATNNHIPHQSDKKPLLYYNKETDTLKKPILRQWDSIEKHANGKYYYHQRSAEVVLNGSEGWGKSSSTEKYSVFYYNPGNKKPSIIICDKFNSVNGSLITESIRNDASSLQICIANSKLTTQDVQGFKQWLQSNNVTVVYQLAKEKVYECTNIDLITYANETNYIVNTGVICPKSTLKVMCNINNVVRELQQKVSNLENYIQHVMIDALNNALNE